MAANFPVLQAIHAGEDERVLLHREPVELVSIVDSKVVRRLTVVVEGIISMEVAVVVMVVLEAMACEVVDLSIAEICETTRRRITYTVSPLSHIYCLIN